MDKNFVDTKTVEKGMKRHMDFARKHPSARKTYIPEQGKSELKVREMSKDFCDELRETD